MNRQPVMRLSTLRSFACLVVIGLAGLSIPDAQAQQVLWVGNDNVAGGSQQYALPISGSSTPNFTVVSSNVVAMAQDGSGNLVMGDFLGQLKFFTAPLSGASTASATFANGAGPNTGQFAFTPTGDFFVGTVGTAVNKFTHPFSNASTPSQVITTAGMTSAIGVALDAAQNMYISDAGGSGSSIFVLAPPYTGAPIHTPAISGKFYRKVAVSGTQLFVADVSGTTGRVDVYNLPITAVSAPAFSITNGTNTPETVALDVSGNLYVGNLGNSTVTVYSSPFSAASAPVTTMAAAGAPAIFGIAIGSTVGSPSIPAIGHLGLMALCALMMVIGLVAVRTKS
ncbi:MAG TPA: hypothetical protein VNN25_27705 [Thermoanaerobaculia bacterium]|nr:hypothetical protein [Thermoanaerobaculia bacterium]